MTINRVRVLLAVCLLLVGATAQAQTTRKVYTGGTSTAGDSTYTLAQLQNAIDDAVPGDTIYIENTAIISAPSTGFVLRQKSCPAQNDTCWITITGGIDSSGAFAGTYPAANVRIGPSNAASLPDILPSANNTPAIRTTWPAEIGPGCTAAPCVASYWRVQRIEVRSFSPWNAGAMISLGTNNATTDVTSGDNQNQESEIPHHIILDQIYVHGDPIDGQHRGMTNAAKYTTVSNSYFDDIKSMQETQAISVINTTGPQTYTNNYIAATGESFFTGGGDGYGQWTATITGTPTTTSATLSLCTGLLTSANHHWFTVKVAGVEYFRMIDTINTSTCEITWQEPTPAIPDVPGTVHWTWEFGGLLFEKNYVTKNVSWRDPIQAGPTGVTATPTTGGTLTASSGNCYRIMSRQKTTNDIYAQSAETAEVCATTTVTNNAVNLSWTASANADEYQIYWRLGNTTRFIATVTGVTSYLHTSPTAGTQVVGTPQSPSVTPVAGGGTLAAGTYHYRIIAQPNQQPATADLVCTLAATGHCDFSWTAVTGATSYRIYGRQSPQTLYITSTGTTASDIGSGTTSGDIFSYDTPSVWTVKNTFELKNCDGLNGMGSCIVRGNIMENSWLQAQTGMVVNIKVNNQNFTEDSGVLRNLLFTDNIIRHGTRALQMCAYDCDGHGSGRMADITISHNVMYDINSTWGTNQSAIYLGAGFVTGAPANRGGQNFTFDHNTILADTTNYGPFLVSSESSPGTILWTDLKWTNNIARHGQNGWHDLHNGSFGTGGEGTVAFNHAVDGLNRAMNGNVWSDATAGNYPDTTGYFPVESALQACFNNYAGGDYSIPNTCSYNNGGTDSTDPGADITTVNAYTSVAASGDNSGSVNITTTTLPDGTIGVAYSQSLAATGGTTPYTWTLPSGSLPAGLTLSSGGVISGTPTGTAATASFTVRATDAGALFTDKALTLTTQPGGGGGGASSPVWNSSNKAGSSSAASLTFSMTPAGTNRYMYCTVATQSTARNATSVVFNGTEALTLRRSRDFDNGSGAQAHVEFWDLVSPTATTANVVVTMNLSTAVAAGCSVYTNVKQTGMLGTFADNGANSNTSTVTATSATGELVIDATSIRVGTTGITEGAGQTNRVEKQSGTGVGNVTVAMSDKPGTTSTTITWAVDDSTNKSWATIAVSLKGNVTTPPIDLTTTTLATGIVGSAYSQTLDVTGGTGPYTFSVFSGTLPAGLSLSASTGVISGTPTSTLTKAFTIRVTDSLAAHDDQAFTLRILPKRPISISGLERNIYSDVFGPALSNNRIVVPGDLWNDESTDSLKRRKADNTWEIVGGGGIAGLSDVAIVAPLDDQALRYNATTNKWQNETLNVFTQGGNAFGVPGIFGTSDQQAFSLISNGTSRLSADPVNNSVNLQANGDNNPEIYVMSNDCTDWLNLGFNSSDCRRIVGQAGGGTNRSYAALAGAVSSTDYIWGVGSSSTSGATNTRWVGVRFDGLFSVKHLSLETGAKPTCSSTERGTFWYVAGGSGVKDTVEVCAKDASNVYSWRVIY